MATSGAPGPSRAPGLGGWPVLAGLFVCVVAVGLATGAVPGDTLTSVASLPASVATGDCGGPSLIAGSGDRATHAADGVLEAFTNALVGLPGCARERVVRLSGSPAKGVGPAVSVTYVRDAGADTAWQGTVGPEGVLVVVPPATEALVSFTNDLVSGSEDRNLRLEMVTP